jgi:hypothetical protein
MFASGKFNFDDDDGFVATVVDAEDDILVTFSFFEFFEI